MKGREKERERRARDLEKKAREQADQCEYRNSVINFPLRAFQDSSYMCLRFYVVVCSGGAGGTTGQPEQRAQHTETHSQQGQISALPQPPFSDHPSIKRIKLLVLPL